MTNMLSPNVWGKACSFVALLSGIILATLLSSCGSSKYGPQERQWELDTISDRNLIKLISKQNPFSPPFMRSTIKVTFTNDDGEISTKMDFTTHEESGIRLVIIPFPMIEAGRIWLNREGIQGAITMGGKRSIAAPWSILSHAAELPLDYCILRRHLLGIVSAPSSFMCLNSSLSPGRETKVVREDKEVMVSIREEGTLYTWKIGSNARPEYLIADNGIEGEYVRWEYGNYVFMENRGYIPLDHHITVYRDHRPRGTVRLQFGRMRFDHFDTSILLPQAGNPVLIRNLGELTRMLSTK